MTSQPWIRPILIASNFAMPVALFVTRFQALWIVALAAIVHGAFIYAMCAPWCAWLGPVATRFIPRGNDVWLTIDDGPAGTDTGRLADELSRRGVRATFFVKGRSLARQPGIAQQLAAAGHTLANHTDTHPSHIFWCLLPRRLRRELDACNDALRAGGVAVTRWFRPPVGLKHPLLHPELRARGMRLVAWNVRGHDGVVCDPDAVLRRVLAHVRPGAILLLHEGRPRSIECILHVTDALLRRGYSFVIPDDEQLA